MCHKIRLFDFHFKILIIQITIKVKLRQIFQNFNE